MTYQKQKGSFSRGKKLNFEFLKFLFRRISFRIQAISIVLLAECYNPLPDMKPLPRCKFKEKKVFWRERNLYLNIELNMKIAIELNLKNSHVYIFQLILFFFRLFRNYANGI